MIKDKETCPLFDGIWHETWNIKGKANDHVPVDIVLLFSLKGAGKFSVVSSDESFKLVTDKVDPVQLKITLWKTIHVSGLGIAFHANCAEELARFEEFVGVM